MCKKSFDYFDLVPPFYFLKLNRYFSACENLPNFPCHFWKNDSGFLQILHQSSVPWNITLLYFFSSNIIYFVQKEVIKVQIFETLECLGPHYGVNLKWQVNSSSNFASFLIVMIHNFNVNLKLIHLLLWIKGSHRSPNLEAFKCCGENLPYSSCHFPNHKSILILYHTSVSWKITPFYCRSNIAYFAQKEPIKVEILRIPSAQIKIHLSKFLSFWKQQIWSNFTWAVESLALWWVVFLQIIKCFS